MVTRISKEGATDAVEKNPTAAGLDALADAAEANNTPPKPAAPAAPADHLEEDVFSALKVAQTFAKKGMWWLTPTEFDELWGDDVLKEAAKPGAEIMRRNGWNKVEFKEKWGPYIGLAMAVGPSAWMTVGAYKAATVKPRPAPAPAPAAEAENGNQTG